MKKVWQNALSKIQAGHVDEVEKGHYNIKVEQCIANVHPTATLRDCNPFYRKQNKI